MATDKERQRKQKPLNRVGAGWIWDHLNSEVKISHTGFDLNSARVKLLAGQSYERCGWLMIGDVAFRGLGHVSDVEGENRLYLGHLVDARNKAVPAVVGNIWLDKSVASGDNAQATKVLLQSGIIKRESDQIVWGEWQESEVGGRQVFLVTFAKKLLPDELVQLVVGKLWTING